MNDELYHYGVKGMKWGVRRSLKKIRSDIRKRAASHKRERMWTDKYRNRHSLSDRELSAAINRLRLENEFKSLAKQAKRNIISEIGDDAKNLLRESGKRYAKSKILKGGL